MTPLSIFDFDRTITRKGTYTPWLIFWASREAPWRLALLPVAVLYGLGYFCRLVSRGRLKELNQSLLMGRSVPLARVAAVAEAYAAQVCQRNVFAGALERLAIERAEGRRIVLATASFAFYVEAIAARLGIADVIATRSVIEGDRLVARIDGENCYEFGKLRMIQAWIVAHGLDGAPARFFSDHVSDLPVFDLVDERIATTPSPALRAVAVERGWEVIDWT